MKENQLYLPNKSNENRGVKYNQTGGNAKQVQIPAPEIKGIEDFDKYKMSSGSHASECSLHVPGPEFQSVVFQILRDAPPASQALPSSLATT